MEIDMEEKQILIKWLVQRYNLTHEMKEFMHGVSQKFSVDGYASYERGLADGQISAAVSEMRFIRDMIVELEAL